MNSKDQKLLQSISQLANCNPFSPQRFELEQKILGKDCEATDSIAWNRKFEKSEGDRPNVVRLTALSASVVAKIKSASAAGDRLPDSMREDYWGVATYLLLYRHITELPIEETWNSGNRKNGRLSSAWKNFQADYRQIMDLDDLYPLDDKSIAHLFACLAQVHRAFFNIFDHILGESLPITRLRERVWESIFTCRVRPYHDGLFARMRDVTTLITGPSGTGKELVARAVGLSQYVPFDPDSSRFQSDPVNAFLPLNLSALSPTLIESELFGHHRGAFTGAVADRVGWLESCSQFGAVFLDEIGDLDVGLQVKLLRVLQQRTYHRLGESKQRCFEGKIIAATNRNLFVEMQAGRFREDFYFRLCTDRILTPSLREQLDNRPEDLPWLVGTIVGRHLNDGSQTELAEEITTWINANLGDIYPWNGNMRELEQCVSSYIIRREYIPAGGERGSRDRALPAVLKDQFNLELSAEELLCRYTTWLYSIHGSYEQVAGILKVDRRTVKSKIDFELLQQLQENPA